MRAPFSLSIALPTFGREGVLVRTLEQVLAQCAEEDEVLVIDQTPVHEPATERQLAAWAEEGAIRWIRHQPPSLTGARNRALREARGVAVLFLDDDVLLAPGLLAEHRRFFGDASVAAVTGQVWNCIDPERPPPLDRPEERTRPHSDERAVCEARNISGGNHSVRREVALRLGGFDTAFRGSALGEDLDFAQRLLLAGHRIVYNPAAWIIHLGLKSGGCAVDVRAPWPEWQHSAGLLLYALRHGFRQGNLRTILWMALRNGPLRKENVRHPLRWPAAWWGFARGLVHAWSHRRFHLTPDT